MRSSNCCRGGLNPPHLVLVISLFWVKLARLAAGLVRLLPSCRIALFSESLFECGFGWCLLYRCEFVGRCRTLPSDCGSCWFIRQWQVSGDTPNSFSVGLNLPRPLAMWVFVLSCKSEFVCRRLDGSHHLQLLP